MKIVYLALVSSVFTLTSFTNNLTKQKYNESTPIVIQSSDGEKLIAKLDCVGCHKLDKKLIGPSYLEISKKYENNDKNINYLSNKIIKGGSGVWGAVPMAAHSSLKKEEAKSMATYILSLNKK
jgi:cytochrome c